MPLLLCVTRSVGWAAFGNYNSVLLGERAAGMGGAFTALSDDPSATPFYNPATTILMNGSSLSAAVNVYNKYETEFGPSADFSQATQRLNRGFFRSLPSSSATIIHHKTFAAGLSILVPDYDFFSGQVKGIPDTNSFLNHIDESLWVGGTFSTRLTRRDNVGVSLYYTARNLARSAADRAEVNNGTGAIITNEEKNLTANSIVAIFGYHRKLSPVWSLGVSYRPSSLPIAGDGTYYRSITETSPYSTEVINRGSLRTITKIPAKVGIGFAREIKGQNTFSFDAHIHEGLVYVDFPELPAGAEKVDHRHVINFAVGFEQVVSDWLKARIGYFTNHSSHPMPDAQLSMRQGDFVNMSGFSANVKVTTANNTSFTFGGYYSGGEGFAIQRVRNDFVLVPKSQQVFTMLIATGFTF
jgi:hypothetical protein